jgi:DNA-binding CsgD family transcriptional regulator
VVDVLRGRRRERETLDRLLAAVRAGKSQVLVLRGDPGVGKSALLDYVAGQAPGFRVARTAAVPAEMELEFSGLHQLCAPLVDRLDRLPDPQRDALCTAFGLQKGEAPSRFLVGLAVLGLLAAVAEEQPLVWVVDDAQWLDKASAQTLTFVARRLGTESVGFVFASRNHEKEATRGLPELVVPGLAHDDARALLGQGLLGPVDERVVDRIVAEARGNPRALLELREELTPAELTGGFGLPGRMAVPRQAGESVQRQLESLPADTRLLLLIAAAEPLGDPVLVWRAAHRRGIGIGAAAPAAGLVEIGAQVRFRNPTMRSAILRAASVEEQRSAHRALAEAIDPEVDPHHRAWHRAQAAQGFDEGIAAELERSARRAQERGGPAAAAAFLEQAAHLTVEPSRRAERVLAAAHAMHEAGSPDAAMELLSTAAAGPLDPLQHARVDQVCAELAFAMNRGSDAAPLLLKAAKQLEPLDLRLARETYLDALAAAMQAGHLACGADVREVAEAARAVPDAPQPPRATDLLLDGLAARFSDGYTVGTPLLRRALSAFLSPTMSEEDGFRWLWHAHLTAGDLGDDAAWDLLATRHVQFARDAGALGRLPTALNERINAHVLLGDLTAAESLLEELHAATAATGEPSWPHGAVMLAAWRGCEDHLVKLIAASSSEVRRRGEGIGLTIVGWAQAVLYNGLGRYEDALAPASQACAGLPQEMSTLARGTLTELIEAATHSGETELAASAFERLSPLARANDTDWALGLEARSRALLSDGQAAEDAYRDAIDRLARTRLRGELARAHLLYGEWLRRERRRLDAREHLRSAHEMFSEMRMEAFAQRAAGELLATGETARKRATEATKELTAREAQIVRLVREGLTNPEIGVRLFISPRTVEWHLSRLFSKLDITSRNQI